MEKDTVKMSSHFFMSLLLWGGGGVDCGWGGGLFFFFPFPCVCLCISLKHTHKHKCTHNFFFLNTHQPSYVHALQRTSSVTITHANRQACICSLTFSDIHIPAHTQTRAHKHTPSIHLDAEDESSPPCGWQSGWQGGGTAPRLAGNMTIVQKPALISPCFAQCIVGLLQTSHEF